MTITLNDSKIENIFKTEFNSNKDKLKEFVENILLNFNEYKNFNYNFDKNHLEAFSNMSVENVEEWLDEKEDEIWK